MNKPVENVLTAEVFIVMEEEFVEVLSPTKKLKIVDGVTLES